MKRSWTNIKALEPRILEMRTEGKTRQEIADALGLTKKQVKNWVWRHNRQEEEIIPKRRGRPRKHPVSTQRELELRVKELEREVELYKSFLHAAGRM